MRVLVTGAHGFIGRHMNSELCNHGHEVVGIDCIHGDLACPYLADQHIINNNLDVVLHLAARVFRVDCEDQPWRTVHDNVTATMMVARACAREGVPLVYASSSEVYGDADGVVCYEDDTDLALPRNLYGLTKRQGEEVCELYAPDSLILRICMPYGPDCPTGPGRAALPTFVADALKGREITVHRGAYRSWCWIDDTVRAIRLLIEQERRGTYNVGHDLDFMSMLDLAHLVCERAGVEARVREVEAPSIQVLVKRISFERLYSCGWRPRVRIEDGVRRLIKARMSA